MLAREIEKDLQIQADQIMEKAKERGLESDFLFRTTFERYMMQLNLLKQIGEAISEQDLLPDACGSQTTARMIRTYNSTVAGTNGTASTLILIIKKLGKEEETGSKLQDFINSFKDDDE